MTNKSKFLPINEEVLIHIDRPLKGFKKIDGGHWTKGFVIIPFSELESTAYAETTGILVEIAENAFPNLKKAPKVGNRVTFKPYAGMNVFGDDDQFYRLLSWKEVRAIHQSK